MTEAAHVKHVEEQTEDKNGQKFQVHILPNHTHKCVGDPPFFADAKH